MKLLAPLSVLTAGAAALAASFLLPAQAASSAWIDVPGTDAVVSAGVVNVVAHATATDGVTSLELRVDEKTVAHDTQLTKVDTDAIGRFSWNATPGTHVLRVTDGKNLSSPPLLVTVVAKPGGSQTPAPLPPPTPGAPSATPSAPATSTATPEPVTEPTPDVTVDPTTTPTPAPSTRPTKPTARPTARPTTRPTPAPTTRPTVAPPTVAPVPAPSINSASIDGSNLLYTAGYCAYTVKIKATTANASQSSVSINNRTFAMSGSANQWTVTLPSGAISTSGTFEVTVIATNSSGTATKSAGSVIVNYGCPKD
jgi:hypothetical protein